MNCQVIVVLLLAGTVASQIYGNNTLCPLLSRYDYPKITANGAKYSLEFSRPVLMQKILIDTTGCISERALVEGSFSAEYIDASDASYLVRTYPKDLMPNWDRTEYIIEIPMDTVLYTEKIILNAPHAIHCSQVYVHGCATDEICHPDTCKNGGTCIGNGNCACAKGFMGDDCTTSVNDMAFDNYDLVSAIAPLGLLFTTDAAFDIAGDVSFTIDGHQVKRRDPHHDHHDQHHHHDNSAHFHGHGGSCHYSHTHNGGYSHGHHSTYGHHSSNTASSSMNGGQSFTHSCHVSHGHGHDHHSTHYLYTTHGCNHHSHGASLHYHNHQLHMHVHDEHHHHHHHVVAPYNPVQGVVNHIVSSFSPHHGPCILINGIMSSHHPHPKTPTTPNPPTGPTSNSLCFGTCGAQNVASILNATLSNMAVAGASISTLTQNNLLGMLGKGVVDFLIHNLLPQVQQQTVTTTAASFPVFTRAPTTTSTAQLLTNPPTTTGLPRVSATSPPNNKHGLICHDCMRVSKDGNCSNAMQCNAGDVCMSMHDRYGYTHRCISKQDCDHGTLKATADCWYCCTSNLCNDKCYGGNSGSCQDDPQCASLRNLGSFYDVCADPALATTTCKKTCKKCP